MCVSHTSIWLWKKKLHRNTLPLDASYGRIFFFKKKKDRIAAAVLFQHICIFLFTEIYCLATIQWDTRYFSEWCSTARYFSMDLLMIKNIVICWLNLIFTRYRIIFSTFLLKKHFSQLSTKTPKVVNCRISSASEVIRL